MSRTIIFCILAAFIIAGVMLSGCVTPPKASTSTAANGASAVTTTETNATATTSPGYVTMVTPFGTTESSSADGTTSSTAYNTFTTPTPLPEDLSCLIYANKQYFAYNTTAITFDLKNPPMYLNYTVVPFNITVNKYVKSRSGSNNYETLTYSDYAPYSWFVITVRDKTTGEIYLQDGFGKAQGYGIYTNATLGPILKSGDLQIEMRGNNITAMTGVWVKPVGNFDDPQNKTFAECKYWGQIRNTLPVVTATTTQTWTPENQKNV
ncbi:MAG: hypothetical protein LUQ31_04225 [Methanoregula sp.]|nr:hypothetical protein [Methanoregula sp.]